MLDLGASRMRFERVEPGHVIAWRSEDGNWVWAFVLEEQDGTTRLISRKPLPPTDARCTHRHVADGARIARNGAEDAARDQRARRAACFRSQRSHLNRRDALTTPLWSDALMPTGREWGSPVQLTGTRGERSCRSIGARQSGAAPGPGQKAPCGRKPLRPRMLHTRDVPSSIQVQTAAVSRRRYSGS
jgi:hypothetical protein